MSVLELSISGHPEPGAILLSETLEQYREQAVILQCAVDDMRVSVHSKRSRLRSLLFKESLITRLDAIHDKLEYTRTSLQHLSNLPISDDGYYSTIRWLNLTSHTLRRQLRRYEHLHHVVAERGIDLGAHIAVHKQAGDSDTYFQAADAVTRELRGRVYGKKWMMGQRERRYQHSHHQLPIASFVRGRSYAVDGSAAMVLIPKHDLYRPRMWCLIAHEFAHSKWHYLRRELAPAIKNAATRHTVTDELQALFCDGEDTELKSVFVAISSRWKTAGAIIANMVPSKYRLSNAELWEIRAADLVLELVSDVVAIRVLGISYLCAFISSGAFDIALPQFRRSEFEEMPHAEVVDWFCGDIHPPNLARIYLMLEVLRQHCNAPSDAVSVVDKFVRFIENIIAAEHGDVSDVWGEYSTALTAVLSDLAGTLNELAIAILGHRTLFTGDDHQRCVELSSEVATIFRTMRREHWSIPDLFNIAWHKRLRDRQQLHPVNYSKLSTKPGDSCSGPWAGIGPAIAAAMSASGLNSTRAAEMKQ